MEFLRPDFSTLMLGCCEGLCFPPGQMACASLSCFLRGRGDKDALFPGRGTLFPVISVTFLFDESKD